MPGPPPPVLSIYSYLSFSPLVLNMKESYKLSDFTAGDDHLAVSFWIPKLCGRNPKKTAN